MTDEVELEIAFVWTCPACKAKVFEDPPRGMKTKEETEAFEADMPWEFAALDCEGGNWVCQPNTVLCPHCLIQYDVEEG